MVDTAWTFAVIFMAIFATLATFAVLWIRAERADHGHKHAGPAKSTVPRHHGG